MDSHARPLPDSTVPPPGERGALRALAEAAVAITRAPSLQATLAVITERARLIVGAHQSVASLSRGPDWGQSINAVSLSPKYERWRDYASLPDGSLPDGSGIYAMVCEGNQPVRMTQAELEAHPRWRGFGAHAAAHPPMRGWLAAPLVAHDGRNLGLLQLSDKDVGEFDDQDLDVLVQLATLAAAGVERAQAEDERRRLAAVVEQSSDFIGIADADGNAYFVNEAGRHLVGLADLEEVRRTRVIDYFAEADKPFVLDTILPTQEREGRWVGPYRFRNFQTNAPVPVHYNQFVIKGPDGTRLGVATVSRDRAEEMRQEAALRDSERRLNTVLDNASVAVLLMDEGQRCVYANAAAERLTGYSFAELTAGCLHDIIHHTRPDGSPYPLHECPIDRAFPENNRMQGEEVFVHKDGSFYPVAFTASPIRDADAKVVGTVIELRGTAEEKRREEARALLIREVDHRAKNVLAVVQSVVRLTQADDPKAFREVVEARIAALARAHALLAGRGWRPADLRTLLEAELSFRGAPDAIRLDGPPVAISATAAQPISMVMHELATNAAKHGALSVPDGRVEVRWRLDCAGAGSGGGTLSLRWTEMGGPPVRGAPERRGFGSRVIEGTMRGQLGGTIARHWEPDGLVVEVALPLARVQTLSGADLSPPADAQGEFRAAQQGA